MLPREHTVKPQNSHCAVCTASKYTAMNGIIYLSAGALRLPSMAATMRASAELIGSARSEKPCARLIRTAAAPAGSRSRMHSVGYRSRGGPANLGDTGPCDRHLAQALRYRNRCCSLACYLCGGLCGPGEGAEPFRSGDTSGGETLDKLRNRKIERSIRI